MTWLDPLGAGFSLLATYLFVLVDKRAWVATLFAVAINLTLYLQRGIYGEACVELYYLMTTLYGWYYWVVASTPAQAREVTAITPRHALFLLGTAAVTIPLFSLMLKSQLHSTVPLLDATTTILSFIAQWLMCRKILENWILWFVVDVIYIGLYLIKGIPFHAGLMLIYLGLAVAGYLHWQKSLPLQLADNPGKI